MHQRYRRHGWSNVATSLSLTLQLEITEIHVEKSKRGRKGSEKDHVETLAVLTPTVNRIMETFFKQQVICFLLISNIPR